MRKYLILLIITMMAAGLFLTACEESEILLSQKTLSGQCL